MIHRIISGILSVLIALSVVTMLPASAFAVTEDSKVYEKDGYTVTYRIGSEWDNNRSVEVTIKNTGEDSILNWALKYDVGGEVYNLWNSTVFSEDEDGTVIKNNGYNYEIEPGQSASYGYIVTGAETLIPEDMELCSRRIDVKSGYDVDFNIINDWHTGFQAEVSITNTSSEPIEAWTLLFDGNFDINNIWNAKLLSDENRSYEVANQLWTTPIQVGESASFGFTADKSATENAKAENFQLTAVIIGESILEYPDLEDIDFELDTDEDGLPDYYEDILGTDKNKADTDGDGLSDGYEVFYLGTDPLKADSDGNGVNDGDEDFDKDGLTNAKECELGTDPNNADTDGDGLNDGAEVNTHGTDPLKFDTDEDGISDGDEITLGLNPNAGATNGTPDSERTFVQTVSSDSEVLSAINDDEDVPFNVSLEMKAAGVAENNVYARESGYSKAIENSAIIGVAPEFVYTDGLAIEEVTVKFELNNSVINNTLGRYAENNDGFKGIKRLTVFMFFEDVNMLLPVETFYDEAANIVYTKTDRVGTYCLMDMEILFQNLGIEPSKAADVEVSEAMSGNLIDNEGYLCYSVSENPSKTSNPDNDDYMGSVKQYKDNFDVVFIIDRVNYDNSILHFFSGKIEETAKTIWSVSPNANITVYAVNGDGNTHYEKYGSYNSETELSNALSKIKKNEHPVVTAKPDGTVEYEMYLSNAVDDMINTYDLSSGDKKVYCFAFFDSNNNKFQSEYNSKGRLHGIKYGEKKIDISVCSNIPSNLKNENEYTKMTYAVALYKMTNGVEITKNNFKDDILIHIYGEIPTTQYIYKAIIATGYQPVVLKKELTQKDMDNAENLYNDPDYQFSAEELEGCEDTDEDGLKDFMEVMFYSDFVSDNEFIKIQDEKMKLPQVADIMKMLDDYGEYAFTDVGLDKAHEQYGYNWAEFLTFPVLPIISDPTSNDGDSDGILDKYDIKGLECNKLPDIFVSYINSERVSMSKIIFDKKEETFICAESISDLNLYCDVKPLYYYDEYGFEVKFTDSEPIDLISAGAFDNWYFIAVKSNNEYTYTYVYSENINEVIQAFNRPAALNILNKIICQSILPFRVIREYSEEHGVYKTIGPVAFGLIASASENIAGYGGTVLNQLYHLYHLFGSKSNDPIDIGNILDLYDSSTDYEKEAISIIKAKYAEFLDTDNEAYKAGMSIGYTFNCLVNVKTALDGILIIIGGVPFFIGGAVVTAATGGSSSAISIPVMAIAGAEVALGAELTYVSAITFSDNLNAAVSVNEDLAKGVRFDDNKIAELQKRADDRAKKYNESKKPYQKAKNKGLVGIKETPNYGVSFEDSPYIFKNEKGQKAVVKIQMTGSRESDFKEANIKFFGKNDKPGDYTWHHLDDYNVATNECTLELVESKAHTASKAHAGACAQYNEIHGPKYK